MGNFDVAYEEWLTEQVDRERNPRRRELLQKGLGQGTVEFLRVCMKQSLLVLDDWFFLPIAYLSIREDPEVCKQLVLAFVGKFLSSSVSIDLSWSEAEALRFARRWVRPFTPNELADHLRLSERRTREVLHGLVEQQLLLVASGKERYRTYTLALRE